MAKKMLGLFLALLMLTVSVVGVAEEAAEMPEINYDEELIADIEGDFADLLAIEIPFEYFVPASLLPQDVPQELLAQGIIGIYQTEDKAANMTVGLVAMTNAEGAAIASLEEVGQLYAAAGYNAQLVLVNECEALLYANEAQDVQGIAFMLEDGRVLSFNFVPASNPDHTKLAEAVISTMGFFDPEAEEDAE